MPPLVRRSKSEPTKPQPTKPQDYRCKKCRDLHGYKAPKCQSCGYPILVPLDPNECKACRGSGKSSKGFKCLPCKGTGKKK